MDILVVGATGQFASLVVPEFKKRGLVIKALIRDNSKAEEAIKNGADDTVLGNLDDKESLKNAVEGMDGVFHIIPAFQNEVASGLNMVNAANDAGVKKFVFSSVYHTSLSLANHADKRPAEEALYHSAMDYTILQPAMYMQMLTAQFESAKKDGKISMPYSKHARMSYVDYRDVAQVAAIAMTDDRLSFGTFELSSEGMLNRLELATLISSVLGKPVEANEIPTEEWVKTAKVPPGELREGLIAMNREYDRYGFSGGNSMILKTILNKDPCTVKEFFKELNR